MGVWSTLASMLPGASTTATPTPRAAAAAAETTGRVEPGFAGAASEAMNVAFEERFWKELVSGRQSTSGHTVTWATALRVTTALRCGLLIADGVATLPCKLMRKNPQTGRREEATDHPLHDVLSYEANPWMDPLQMLETMVIHAVFTGDAIAFVNRVRGRIVEIVPLQRDRVEIEQKADYSLVYRVAAPNGEQREIPQSAIWHLRGPSWNGWRGLDPVHLAREALGLALATENAHAKRFSAGVQASGMYSVDGTLTDEQYKRLRAWLVDNHVGATNSGKPFLLDRSAKWTSLGMSGVDAEHVRTREFQIEEACRAFGVWPIMVGHSDKAATFASAEQMFLAHAVHTLRPWHRRCERSMKRQLLTRDEVRAGYYIKFFDAEMLRGAAKDRAEYYWKRFQMGMSPNQIAELEDEDGFEGGDHHFVPAAYQTVENAAKAKPAGIAGRNGGPLLDEDGGEAEDGGDRRQDDIAAPGVKRVLNVGRVLSAANESKIRDARDNLDTVLAKLDAQPEAPAEGEDAAARNDAMMVAAAAT